MVIPPRMLMRLQKFKAPDRSFHRHICCILVMIGLVICVVWQVFSRYVLSAPSTMTDEMARFSMIWVGLLGAAYGVGAQSHLSIDLLTMNLRGKRSLSAGCFINICVLVFAAGVLIGAVACWSLRFMLPARFSSHAVTYWHIVYGVLPPVSAIVTITTCYLFWKRSVDFYPACNSHHHFWEESMMDWTISLVMFGSFFVLVFLGGADLLFYRVGLYLLPVA